MNPDRNTSVNTLYSHLFHCSKYGTFTGGTMKQCASVAAQARQPREREWEWTTTKQTAKKKRVKTVAFRTFIIEYIIQLTDECQRKNKRNKYHWRTRALTRSLAFATRSRRDIGIAHLNNSELLAEPSSLFPFTDIRHHNSEHNIFVCFECSLSYFLLLVFSLLESFSVEGIAWKMHDCRLLSVRKSVEVYYFCH